MLGKRIGVVAVVVSMLALAAGAPGAKAARMPKAVYAAPWFGVHATAQPARVHPLPGGSSQTYWSWGVDAMHAPDLWDRGITGKGVKVAVVDSGIDLDHPYFAGHIGWTKSYCPYSPTVEDDNGHGTHVAGIVKQMAPDVTLYVLKILAADGTNSPCGTPDAVMVMNAAAAGPDGALGTADDADIVTASVGSLNGVGTPLGYIYKDPFTDAYAAGTTFVASAGNNGPVTDGVDRPASFPSVVSVAALGSIPGDHTWMGEYSSNGINDLDDTSKGVGEVEVAAPGTDVVSTYPGTGADNAIAMASGTSQAAPHVAGLLALYEQARPGLPTDEVRALLRCTAEDLAFNGGFTRAGFDESSGYGAPDARNATAGVCAVPLGFGDVVTPATDARRDYDGDGFGDAADPFNALSDARVHAAASDFVEFNAPGSPELASNFADDIVIAAPDGRSMHVVPSPLLPAAHYLKVYLDGRLEGETAGMTVEGGPLVGAPADGTWLIRRGEFSVATVARIQGKTLQVEGCCSGPGANEVLFNWHEAGSFTYYTQTYSGGVEESPRYARMYTPGTQ